MSALLLILLILPGPLHINVLPWAYITPCLLFDFCNLLHLLIRIVLYFKHKGAASLDDTLELNDVTSKEFIPPSNDIGNAHIQTVREAANVEDLSQGRNEESEPMASKPGG